MKTLKTVFWAWVIFGLLAASCSQTPGLTGQAEEQGTLQITLSPSSLRTTLTEEESRLIANGYELIIFNDQEFISAHVLAQDSLIIGLDPGQYSLVVLAGTRRSATAMTSLLVGSGYTQDTISVVPGERTHVSIRLLPIFLTMDIPSEGVWGSTHMVKIIGKAQNPRIGMFLHGSSTLQRPRLKSDVLWGGYRDFSQVHGSPTEWEAIREIEIPLGTDVFDIQFIGAQVGLVYSDETIQSLSGLTTYTWKWPNAMDLALDNPLAGRIIQFGTGTPPETGVDLDIDWL